MIALCATLTIIALCLFCVTRELQKQTPRNTRRHFGV